MILFFFYSCALATLPNPGEQSNYLVFLLIHLILCVGNVAGLEFKIENYTRNTQLYLAKSEKCKNCMHSHCYRVCLSAVRQTH